VEEEADLRKALHPMDALKWVAFESSTGPRGISTRAVVVFR